MYESNREFPERVCAAEGLIPVEPLWGESTDRLYREFVLTGADARIVTVRDGVLDPSWLGRRLTLDLLTDITAAGVDPCGEHGEYHTVVVDAPAFSSPIGLGPRPRVPRRVLGARSGARRSTDETGRMLHASELSRLLVGRQRRAIVHARQRQRDRRARIADRTARPERLRQDDAAQPAERRAAAASRRGVAERRLAGRPIAARHRQASRRRAAGNASRVRLHGDGDGADGTPSRISDRSSSKGPSDLALARDALAATGTAPRRTRLHDAQRRRETARRHRQRADADAGRPAARRADGVARSRLPARSRVAAAAAQSRSRRDDGAGHARSESRRVALRSADSDARRTRGRAGR